VHQNVVEGIVTFFLIPIGNFLALDAISCPRYSVKALDADVFLAMQAHSKRAIVYTV